MSRNVSPAGTRAMFAEETSEAFLFKILIEHTSFAQPYRFINDKVEKHTDAALDDWLGFPFDITLPDDRDDEIASVTLTIDNVDRQIIQEIRSISSPPSVTLWLCLSSDIDDILAGPYVFNLVGVNWDALTISGSLEFEPILNMIWPKDTFNPRTAPGLFLV